MEEIEVAGACKGPDLQDKGEKMLYGSTKRIVLEGMYLIYRSWILP